MRKARGITGRHGSMLIPDGVLIAAPRSDRHRHLPVAPEEPTLLRMIGPPLRSRF